MRLLICEFVFVDFSPQSNVFAVKRLSFRLHRLATTSDSDIRATIANLSEHDSEVVAASSFLLHGF